MPAMRHGLSRVLALMHPHTCHQVLLDRVTACVSHTENTTKFCSCGKSHVHYLAHCCQTTILHRTVCCAVLYKLLSSLRCVLSGCTVISRPTCIALLTLTSAPRPLSLSHQLSKGLGWASEPVWTFLEKRKALSPARI